MKKRPSENRLITVTPVSELPTCPPNNMKNIKLNLIQIGLGIFLLLYITVMTGDAYIFGFNQHPLGLIIIGGMRCFAIIASSSIFIIFFSIWTLNEAHLWWGRKHE